MGGYTDPLFTHLNRNYNDSRGTIVLLLNVVFEAANTCWTESHSVSHSLNLFFFAFIKWHIYFRLSRPRCCTHFRVSKNCEGWVWDRATEEGKAEGCEVSFSFGCRRIFQLQQVGVDRGTGTAGLPRGERDRRSEMRWLFSKHPDHALQQITSHHAGGKKKEKEIINKRNQCAFSANHGAAVCEAAALDARSLGWFVPYKWYPGNACNYKVKLHTCKF